MATIKIRTSEVIVACDNAIFFWLKEERKAIVTPEPDQTFYAKDLVSGMNERLKSERIEKVRDMARHEEQKSQQIWIDHEDYNLLEDYL